MPRKAAFFKRDCGSLDADAELGGLLVAGVRVEIVGRAMVELVAKANLAANPDADRGGSHSDGEPADDPEGFALVLLIEKREACGVSGHAGVVSCSDDSPTEI